VIIAANVAAAKVLIAIARGFLSVDGHGRRRSAAAAIIIGDWITCPHAPVI